METVSPLSREEQLLESNRHLADALKDENISRDLSTLKDFDKLTYDHSIRVGFVASELAAAEGLSEDVQMELAKSGMLHDLGKTAVKKEMIKGETPLTDEERKHLEEHPRIGFEMVKQYDPSIAEIIVAHHEFQPNSYPRTENREESSLRHKQRLLALADQTDALLSARSYKPAWTPEETEKKLTETFDPNLAKFAIKTRLAI